MENPNSDNTVYDITLRIIILLGIITWCLLIIYPFVNIILWSLILAIAFYPVHDKLTRKTGGKPKLASFIIIISILIILIIPSGLIVSQLIEEVRVLKASYDVGTLKIPHPPESIKEWPVIGQSLYGLWLNAFHNLEQLILKYKNEILDIGGKILDGVLNATGGFIQIIISLFISGILLSYKGSGEAIRKFFRRVGGDMGDQYSDLVIRTIRSVVKGVLGEALVLSLMNGIVFLLAGVPYAGIWTLLVFILAVLQMPVFFVTAPIMIYFFAVKDFMPALFWTILLILVSISDNFLTPMMLGKNAPVPMPVIFIGVIGGCILSGFIGLFTGAIVMAIGYTLLVGWINPIKEDTVKVPESNILK